MSIELVAFCSGLLFVAVAIFGGIEIKELKVPTLSPFARVLSFLVGCGLLYVFFTEPNRYNRVIVPVQPPAPKEAVNAPDDDEEELKKKLSAASNELTRASESLKQYDAKLGESNDRIKALEEQIKNMRRAESREAEQARQELQAVRQRVDADNSKRQEAAQAVHEKQRQVDQLTIKTTAKEAQRLPIIGYVMYAVIDKNSQIRKTYFKIDDKTVRFPGPNDTLEPILNEKRTKIALRARPYHWDYTANAYSAEGEVVSYLTDGQKVVVGGDVFIATDSNNGEQYAIAPITRPANFELETPAGVLKGIPVDPNCDGYVFLGRIDDATGDFADKGFDNQTRPDAVYPAPNETLRALRNTNLRSGPRYWDVSKQGYVNAPTVGDGIKVGQEVRVVGDTVLSSDGKTVWAPVMII